MEWSLPKRPKLNPPHEARYFISYRMLTGSGRIEASSDLELSRTLEDLRLACAWDITVVDADGKLVVFDLGA